MEPSHEQVDDAVNDLERRYGLHCPSEGDKIEDVEWFSDRPVTSIRVILVIFALAGSAVASAAYIVFHLLSR